jgi:dTDP-glucose pyrophosphorylase
MKSLIITMAGESSRFARAGIATPKYRVEVKGKSLFSWSLHSLQNFIDAEWNVVLVGRRKDADLSAFVDAELQQLGCKSYELVLLDEPTDGQASTAILAAPYVDHDDAAIIYNIDTHVNPHDLQVADFHGDGWVPCFPGVGDGWSFIAVDEAGRAAEVREKVRISPHATVGLYGFGTFQLFADAYETSAHREGAAEQKERYIAPLYNTLIKNGGAVYKHCLPFASVIPLGTPQEVEQFAGN